MDVADRHHGDAGHGDNQLTVFLDALDVAFSAFVDAVDHAYVVAGVILGRVSAEILGLPPGVGGGHQNEGTHLHIGNDPGLLGFRPGVVHEVVRVLPFEVLQPFLGAVHEHQRGDQLLLLVLEPPLLILLDGVVRHIGLHALHFPEGLQVHNPVVKHLQGVPIQLLIIHDRGISFTPRPSWTRSAGQLSGLPGRSRPPA